MKKTTTSVLMIICFTFLIYSQDNNSAVLKTNKSDVGSKCTIIKKTDSTIVEGKVLNLPIVLTNINLVQLKKNISFEYELVAVKGSDIKSMDENGVTLNGDVVVFLVKFCFKKTEVDFNLMCTSMADLFNRLVKPGYNIVGNNALVHADLKEGGYVKFGFFTINKLSGKYIGTINNKLFNPVIKVSLPSKLEGKPALNWNEIDILPIELINIDVVPKVQ